MAADFSKLQNIYWFIRYQRRKNLKRKYYRQAADEKKRLIDSGVDKEELRLFCRALARKHCEISEKRLQDYLEAK
ncbi:hypothetical protein [Nitrosomonas sp.]|uniref:hypothetical protein n=1 Tax=Nitrosomonas sp. TaxID=42353 RepID=UPI0025D7A631|nr:hypothetical protein [Nitrosomonas sp.]MBV6446700.1 hypothetical protein [Nitrosomonas sp.]MBV6446711.1 hypothetical protein [Nitrosomonas sp.]